MGPMVGASPGTLFLGLDLSTQSATGILLDGSLSPAAPTLSVNFERSLPEYGTKAGMRVAAGGVVTSPVRMWLAALDQLMDGLAATGLLARVAAISVSGQQHGSVYWSAEGIQTIGRWRNGAADWSSFSFARELHDGCFALAEAPIWADSSTEEQCAAFETFLPGGAAALAATTGSRAYARFTGPQITAVSQRTPEAWAKTAAVSLVSSFVTSLLLGSLAPIDASDACGTNLVDFRARQWYSTLLEAAAPGLTASRLGGQPCDPNARLGSLAEAVAHRWGLPIDCAVIAASGDNPCSLAGLGISSAGDVALSLGTSDTLLGVQSVEAATPALEGHVMVLPTDAAGSVFCMLCYSNGGDVRRKIRDGLCGGSWDAFDQALASTSPGNGGILGLRLELPEITPVIRATGEFILGPDGKVFSDTDMQLLPPAVRVRAAVEGKFLSMRGRGGVLGLNLGASRRLLATGGGTASKALLQVAADVFGCPVLIAEVPDAAAVGAARRAAFGLALGMKDVDASLNFENFVYTRTSHFNKDGKGGTPETDLQGPSGDYMTFSKGLRVAALPRHDAASIYTEELVKRFKAFEDDVAGYAQAS